MIYKPHDYQEYSIKWILEHPKAGLFLDMGLGRQNIMYPNRNK